MFGLFDTRLDTGIAQPPAGVVLHTPDAIVQNAQRVYQQVVVTRIMPLGNVTQMTDQERAARRKLPPASEKVSSNVHKASL